jgi:ATP-binding cassette subfamily B (MDR/TAP) protein 1
MARILYPTWNSVISIFLSVSWYALCNCEIISKKIDGRFPLFQSSVFGTIQAGTLFAYVPEISSAKRAGSDVIKLLDSTPAIDSELADGNMVSAVKVDGQVRLKDIIFRYPTRPSVLVLNGLSLTAKPGTYIALVGASGSGKSTV